MTPYGVASFSFIVVNARTAWAGVAAPLGGLLPFDCVKLLQHLHWDRQVIVFKLEDRLRVVQQDVRVQNVGLSPYFNLMLR